MSILEKELSLYDRNGDGELIPKKVDLQLSDKDAEDYPELKGKQISIIPLTRGEIKEMFGATGKEGDTVNELDTDARLILKKCIVPKFAESEIVHAKPVVVRSIVKTILSESGVKITSSGEKKIDEDADEFGKNS